MLRVAMEERLKVRFYNEGGRWRERRPAGVHINCVVCWSTETRNKREYQKEVECKSSEQTLTDSRCLIRLLFDQVCEEHMQ